LRRTRNRKWIRVCIMTKELIDTDKGAVAVYSALGEALAKVSDFLDLLVDARADTIALKKEDFDDRFYDLETGLAGEMLQKLSNYNRRLIIIGDFGDIKKKSLRDFIYESNRTGKVVFVDSLQKGINKLR